MLNGPSAVHSRPNSAASLLLHERAAAVATIPTGAAADVEYR